MKKYILLTAAAMTITLPAMAAGQSAKSQQTQHWDTDAKIVVNNSATTSKQQTPVTIDGTGKMRLALNDGNHILINEGAVYVLREDGSRFLAPTAPYTAKNGMTIYVEDGAFLRSEAPAQIVYIDADLEVEKAGHKKADAKKKKDGAHHYNADIDTRTERYNGNQ